MQRTRDIRWVGVIVAGCLAGAAWSQDSAEPGDLSDVAIPFRSIDPALDDLSDLGPLRKAIGAARVVVLGEQSHGDGPVFLAKARMIRFLHREMGFDVLCWESNLLGCLAMNERIADKGVAIEEAFDGVFPIWIRSEQVLPTLEYVRASTETDRPITQIGMDSQVTGAHTAEVLKARAAVLLDSLDAPAPDDAVAGLDLLAGVGSGRGGALPDEETARDIAERLGKLSAFLGAHLDTLKERHEPREVELVARSIDDAAWFCRLIAAQQAGGDLDPVLLNERDRRMGDNLAWLAETYFPDRRIIVWAATRHAVHRQKEIEFPDSPGMYDNMDSMGETAHARLGAALYTIGFTAGRGTVGVVFRNQPHDIGPPREGSIEASLEGVGRPFLFVDFRSLPAGHPVREVQWMRPLGYAWQRARWPEQMDGLVFIDTMFPSTPDERAPAGYPLTVGE